MKYVIFCENGGSSWWIADVNGDPGRTKLEENAQRFNTNNLAQKKILKLIEENPHRMLKGRLEVKGVIK